MLLARAGLGRLFGTSAYRPSCNAISKDFDGVIFVHNNPVAIPLFKNRHPRALLCLWANNELFRTYSDRETLRIARNADRLICCSQFIAESLRCRIGELAHKLRVVHNGADIERFRLLENQPSAEVPVVLFVGRVQPIKGPDLLLKAAIKINNGGRKFKIRIVGSSGFSASDPLTPYELELRRLAEPLGDCVEFQPFVGREQIVKEFHSASIFCVPSNWDEPVSLTVPEGLASGLSTIASRRGGIPEVGGDAVLYFDPPDVDQLASHLAMLLDRPVVRAEWANRARQQAATVAWPKQYAKLMEAIA
jgi:glycosyltransferase involved in cell wall biosynthesis